MHAGYNKGVQKQGRKSLSQNLPPNAKPPFHHISVTSFVCIIVLSLCVVQGDILMNHTFLTLSADDATHGYGMGKGWLEDSPSRTVSFNWSLTLS